MNETFPKGAQLDLSHHRISVAPGNSGNTCVVFPDDWIGEQIKYFLTHFRSDMTEEELIDLGNETEIFRAKLRTSGVDRLQHNALP